MKKTKKGFTLVELLVVIAIIAIIAAVAVPVTIGQIEKSKEKTAASEMTNITAALNTAYGEAASTPGTTIDAVHVAPLITISTPQYVKSFTISDGQTLVFTLDDAAPAKAKTAASTGLKLDVANASLNGTYTFDSGTGKFTGANPG